MEAERACAASAASFLAFTAGHVAAAAQRATMIATSVEKMINLGNGSQEKTSAMDGSVSALQKRLLFFMAHDCLSRQDGQLHLLHF